MSLPVLSNLPNFSQTLPYPALPLVLSTSASFYPTIPFLQSPPSTSLPHTPPSFPSISYPGSALHSHCSPFPFKPRHLDPGHLRHLAQAMCKFVWPRSTHSIRQRPELCRLPAPHAKPQHPRKMRASSGQHRDAKLFTNLLLFFFCYRWSVGSALFLLSWAVLMGPWSYAKHLVSGPRLPFTAAYFGSIAMTLYFAIGVCIFFFFWMFIFLCSSRRMLLV